MKQSKIFGVILLIVGIALCLWGCSGEPTVPTYTVRFYVEDTLHSQQTVTEGEYPTEPSVEMAGMLFRGWQNKAGQVVDVTATPITADTDYNALMQPALDQHTPYLFTDEMGFARPNDALTAQEFSAALNALAGETAKKHFPPLPAGSGTLSCDAIRKYLAAFFPAEEVDGALPDSGASLLSRGEFAAVMNLLLKRGISEQLVLPEQTKLPPDLFQGQTGTYDMLEAVVSHETGATGLSWQDMEIPSVEAGFLNINGWLYYLREDGQFLKDGDVGALHFGPDGRYTCGDAELDAYVAQILAQLISENPEMDKLELLRQCQIYCRDTFDYLRRNAYEFGITGWEIEDAKTMITKGRGNCYNFAAVFWALARGLGYEAYAISGTCLKDQQPHSWVMIAFDGEEYFFDPEWEWAYHDREVYDKDMFMISMTNAKYWGYKWTPHW